jgi:hypothetical protein
MSAVIDMITGKAITEGLQHDAAQVVKIRNATIAECQRSIRAHGEMIGRVDREGGRHYRDVAALLEVLKS